MVFEVSYWRKHTFSDLEVSQSTSMPVVLVTPVLACSTRTASLTQHNPSCRGPVPPPPVQTAAARGKLRLVSLRNKGTTTAAAALPRSSHRSNPDTLKVSRYQRMVTEITGKHQFLSKTWLFHTPHTEGAAAVIGGEEKDIRNCREMVTGGGLMTSKAQHSPTPLRGGSLQRAVN